MANREDEAPPWLVRSVAAPLVLIAISVGMLVWSAQYNATARQVPMLVSGAMLVLSIIDLLCRIDSEKLRPLRDFWGGDFQRPEMRHNPRPIAEFAQFAWMFGCVGAMLLIGILPAVPLFVFAYMAVHGRCGILASLATAATVFAFVFLVFEVFLDYRLYVGALFDPRGFAGW